MTGSIPRRTCVGCRERADQTDLLRVVARGSRVVPDDPAPTGAVRPKVRQEGRGAYMHPVVSCVELAIRRRAFPRALRIDGPADSTAVVRAVQYHVTVQGSGERDEHPMTAQS